MTRFLRLKYLVLLLIIFNILLASRWIIDGNLFFHTDIARDFLLMEDIADNKHLALLGPRSGAIPGLFHGPLWLYLNLPSFIIGNGNPVFVAWFWVLLYTLSLVITYYAGKKLFGEKEGMLAALLLSSVTILNVRSLFNPFGALLLSPLYLYFLLNYLQTKKVKILIIALFILGLIIQFQMAFGVPILILTFLLLAYFFIKNKKFFHVFSFLILIIPLSTFILFDLRNKFLQVKSVIAYLGGSQSHGKLGFNFFQLIGVRVKEMFMDGLGVITQNNQYLTMFFLTSLIILFFKILKRKNSKKEVYLLILYFYLGFWLMTVLFKGQIWNYYYIPFIPLLIFLFVNLKNVINKWVFYILFALIYLINLQPAIIDTLNYVSNPALQDVSTWRFNELIAREVFNSSNKNFGYFIFTPDLYGYSPRYALNYLQKQNKEKISYPYQKMRETYLVIAPAPVYGRDPNSIWYQKNTNSSLWKSNDIKITGKPSLTTPFINGFVIEKYNLSDREITIEANPYLIKDIFFR